MKDKSAKASLKALSAGDRKAHSPLPTREELGQMSAKDKGAAFARAALKNLNARKP